MRDRSVRGANGYGSGRKAERTRAYEGAAGTASGSIEGRTRSTFDLGAVLATADYAHPHVGCIDGQTVALPLLSADRILAPLDPAAGLWSSAREQASWLQTLLAGGVAPDGTRLVSTESLERVWRQRDALPEAFAQGGTTGYGTGWFVGEAAGWRLLSHSGSTVGFAAELAVLPEADLGIVVLTNGGSGAAALVFVVQQRLFELLLGVPPRAEDDVERAAAATAALLAGSRARLGEFDPAAIEPFLGRYANPDLGPELLLTSLPIAQEIADDLGTTRRDYLFFRSIEEATGG